MNLDIKQRIEQIKNGEVPEGYTNKYHIKPDSWKDEPLNMFFYKVKDKNHEKRYNTVFTNSAANGVIPQNEYFEKDIANEENIGGYYIVNAEDYIYNPRISEKAPYGPINQNQTGYTGIASPLYTVFAKKENICVCDEYVRYYLSSTEWNKYIYSVANYGARFDRMNISDNDFMNMPIALPQIKEQQKIAEILMQCDKVIELYEKEIEELQKLKKIYLKKMFPQKGSNVPEFRFNQFTELWQQRKICDEFDKFIVPMRDKPKEFGGSIPWTRIEDIEGKYLNDSLSGNYVTEETVKKMNLKIIPKNSLIVSSSATFGVVAVTTQDLITNQTFIGLVPNDQETLDYWYAFFQSDEARKYMRLESAGSTIFYISRESFENMPIKVPSKDEMLKIGACFNNLDNLIILHQNKLDEKKKCKKSLMQLLLTGIVRVDV